MMNDNGDLREDLKVPDGDLGTQIRADFENGRELLVSFITACFAHLIYYMDDNHVSFLLTVHRFESLRRRVCDCR
jgi:translation initiation factor 5A